MTDTKPNTRLSAMRDDELLDAASNPQQLKETGVKILKALREADEKTEKRYRY